MIDREKEFAPREGSFGSNIHTGIRNAELATPSPTRLREILQQKCTILDSKICSANALAVGIEYKLFGPTPTSDPTVKGETPSDDIQSIAIVLSAFITAMEILENRLTQVNDAL